MKARTILPLVMLAITPVLVAQQTNNAAGQSERYYRAGLAAVQKGDSTGARLAFERALQLNPGHANARYHMLQLRGSGEKMAAKARELELKKVKLPAISFDEVTLEEAVNALDIMVRKESKARFVPNFIIQDSSGALAKRPVSLQLRNVPADVALKYTLELVQATARFEEHAILIQPAGAAKGAAGAKAGD